MRKMIFLAAITAATWIAPALAQNADAITGIWLSEDKDGKIEIYKSGNYYYGKLIWGKGLYEADGKTPKKDTKNPDTKLRERPLLNLVMLSRFTYEDGEWIDGEVYDPTSGKTYSSKMMLNGKDLELRGFIGTSLFGKSTIWTRVR